MSTAVEVVHAPSFWRQWRWDWVYPLLAAILVIIVWRSIENYSRQYSPSATAVNDESASTGPQKGWMAPWALLLASIPTLIIVQQAIYLNTVKRLSLRWPGELQEPAAYRNYERDVMLHNSRQRSIEEFRDYFSWPTLLKRYLAPCVLMFVSVLGVFYLVCITPDCCSETLPATAVMGLRFGALGAYVYLLLSIGQRALQADILPGFVMWCAAQMPLGSLLGGALSAFWLTPQSSPPTDASPVAAGLFFLAGLSPRIVVSAVQDALRKLWLPASSSGAASRSLALSQLRGITPAVEERLNEEGIFDVFTMAMANPLKLIRNTPFDQRQLLSWIDEALLIYVLPQNWQLAESEGITGAIDLAWLERPGDAPLINDPHFGKLAERLKLAPQALADTIQRLSEDAQVIQVWALYQDDGANS
jgi:hypothetical protein